MIFEWEKDKDRISRFMKIPSAKKLEWLGQINNFLAKFSTRETRAIRDLMRKRIKH